MGDYYGVHHSAPQVGPRGADYFPSDLATNAEQYGTSLDGNTAVVHPFSTLLVSLEGRSFCRVSVFFCRFVQHALLFLPHSYLLPSSRTATYVRLLAHLLAHREG